MPGDSDQQRLDAAFAQAKDELSRILEDAAQASVEGTIGRLSHQVGPFRIAGADVEVVIRNLELTAGDGPQRARRPAASKRVAKRAAAARPTAKAPRAKRAVERRGRPSGPVRLAVLDAFATAGAGTLTTDQVREALDAQGVVTSVDNVHQQLRRLVQAGALERAGRGVYRPINGSRR